jgi:hypothetical protein
MARSTGPNSDHLKWLVESRARNQRVSLDLFDLIKTHPEKLLNSDSDLKYDAQNLVAISFSLWRAAFLADRTGHMEERLKDAERFLGKMLTDNAITYAQDRDAREWTFNYYMANARYRLEELGEDWSEIIKSGLVPPTGLRVCPETSGWIAEFSEHEAD